MSNHRGQPGDFRYLTELGVGFQSDSLEAAIAFFQLTHSVPLKKFDLGFVGNPSQPMIEQLMATLYERCQSDTLSAVSLRCHMGTGADLDVRAITEPLLKFKNMHSIMTELPTIFSNMDKNFLKHMATAWPHLDTLVLSWGVSESIPPHARITVDGLRVLAACPNLVNLALPLNLSYDSALFDARPLPKTPEIPNVRSLIVEKSTITNPCLLARSLWEMMPNVEIIDCYVPEPGPGGIEAWRGFEHNFNFFSQSQTSSPEARTDRDCLGLTGMVDMLRY